MKLTCCFIDDDREPCTKDAEWTVIYGSSPDDVTEGCPSHAALLLDDKIMHAELVRL